MRSIGRWAIRSELARGGMGVVYRAAGPGGEEVALKLLLRTADQARRRFQREAQALLRLHHESIVGVREVGEHEGAPFLVLDLVEGESLQDRLHRAGVLPPAQAAEVCLQVAHALAHAHAQGVLHRDVKPANVLLRARDGAALLTDFGLARELEGAQSRLSRTGAQLGTPGYWPPEQALGELHRIGPASDVYSLGATLYAALTGQPPLVGDSVAEQVVAAHERAPRPPSALRPGIPARLEQICLRCLAKAPEERYPTAEALAVELHQFLGGGPRPRRSGAPAFVALGVTGLGALAAAAVLLLRARAPEPTAPAPAPVATSSAHEPPPEAKAIVQEGKARFVAGDYAGAIEAFERAVALDPAYTGAHGNLGTTRLAMEDYAGARAHFDRALELDPDRAQSLYGRGFCRTVLGDLSGGQADLERALARLGPQDPLAAYTRVVLTDIGELVRTGHRLRSVAAEAAFERGTSLVAQGDPAGAVEAFAVALAADPDHVVALRRRASARLQLVAMDRAPEREATAALLDLDRALGLRADYVEAWFERAQARALLRDPSGALADYDRTLELDPAHGPAHAQRGELRLLAGDAAGAAADLARALELLAPDAPGREGVAARLQQARAGR